MDAKAEDKADENSTPKTSAPCQECHAGKLHLSYITYFTWLNEELITVPNFPAWVCDVCGRREFDYDAVSWLNALLSPAAGRSPAQTAHRKITPPEAEISNPEEISPLS